MTKTTKVTWLGDEDPNVQSITEGGLTFVKGEPTTVPCDHTFNGHDWVERFVGNPAFAVDDSDAEPVESPGEEDAIKAKLDAAGVKYAPKASVETLRGKLPS